jgi:hypothetical protein
MKKNSKAARRAERRGCAMTSRFTFTDDEETVFRPLRLLSRQSGIPMIRLIRAAVRQYVVRERWKLGDALQTQVGRRRRRRAPKSSSGAMLRSGVAR